MTDKWVCHIDEVWENTNCLFQLRSYKTPVAIGEDIYIYINPLNLFMAPFRRKQFVNISPYNNHLWPTIVT